MKHIRTVLRILNKNDFSIKPKKCSWVCQEIVYLGSIISKEGVHPDPRKVAPILRIVRPRTPTQLRAFIGMVNYYCDHMPHRAHVLAPLTAQSKNKKYITWSDDCQKAFEMGVRLVEQAS